MNGIELRAAWAFAKGLALLWGSRLDRLQPSRGPRVETRPWPTRCGSTTIAAPCSPEPRKLESERSSGLTRRERVRRTASSTWPPAPRFHPHISPTSRPSSGTSAPVGPARPSSAASVTRATTQPCGCSSRPGGFSSPGSPPCFLMATADALLDRRAFLPTLGGGLLAAPLAAEAQQPRTLARIGYLGTFPPGS